MRIHDTMRERSTEFQIRKAITITSCFVLATLLLAVDTASAQDVTPIISEQERHLAITDPDRFAWMLFTRINQPLSGSPDGRVIWEGWALASNVFRDPLQEPKWPTGSIERESDSLESLPLQQVIRNLRPGEALTAESMPRFDPRAAEGQFNETRMNRASFDFIVRNNLYFVEGQEEFFFRGENLNFPADAMEIKAQWRRIKPDQASLYHTAETSSDDGSKTLWGLTALHITTKDLPNWFWATFEHKSNVGIDAVVPSRDSYGLPTEMKNTKWENYVLRGSQVDFVDSFGRPTILANSQIEQDFQQSSSCITCHARSTIGNRPRNGVDINRLSVFEGESGSIGAPNPSWYVSADREPSARHYVQLDFVWSLFRAQRRNLPAQSTAPADTQ